MERKTAFENWTQIGFVEGNGTTVEFSNYRFLDIHPESGNNYYRLKQIDFDGAFDYSDIRVIEFTKAGIEISIYPNPTNDVVNIQLDENIIEGELQLYHQLGRLVLQDTIIKSEYLKTIKVSQFPNGVYTINIISDDQRFTEKFIVQKPN